MADRSIHWNDVYTTKPHDAVSWYAPRLADSLALIETLDPERKASVVDIGGGEATLVDDLLASGRRDLAVLDVSEAAIAFSRRRLAEKAGLVDWYVADVTRHDFGGRTFDIWHDRAVFHFLTDPRDRAAYVDLVKRSVAPGGHVVMATFGPNGPLKCSDLDVVRYDDRGLHDQFGPRFELLGSRLTDHVTPRGTTQQFLYCWCRVDAGREPG